jgi:signal transduction histidine kinase
MTSAGSTERRLVPVLGVAWADVLLAVAVGAAEIVGTEVWLRATGAEPMAPLGYLLLLVTAAPLAFRDRYPVGVLAVVITAAIAYTWLAYAGGFYTLAVFLAMWAAVSAGHRLAAVIASVGLVGAFVAASLAVGAGHAVDPDAPLWLGGWLVASFVLGEVSRGRRQYLEAVEQRVIDAERTREEEARRRAGEERLRIARELHDVLAHNISMINVQAGVAVHLLDKQPDQARTALVAISQASKEALRELRATLGVLRQVDEAEPLAPAPGLAALEDLVAGASAAGLDVDVQTTGEPRPLPAGVDLAAYRIIQESLTNVARHSGAKHVDISLDYGAHDVAITVVDDGVGVPVGVAGEAGVTRAAEGAVPRAGNGLTGMRERAAAAGGELEAGPRPEGGFRVRARLPVGGTA